jgi:hypothetical protein
MELERGFRCHAKFHPHFTVELQWNEQKIRDATHGTIIEHIGFDVY